MEARILKFILGIQKLGLVSPVGNFILVPLHSRPFPNAILEAPSDEKMAQHMNWWAAFKKLVSQISLATRDHSCIVLDIG